MESTNKNKHLVLDDRYDIQHGLDASLSFKAIGAAIGKDCTTVSKEIRAHIIFVKKGASYRPFNDCANRFHCNYSGDACDECSRKNKKKCSTCGSCVPTCADYKKKYAHYSRNLPTSATDAPRETNALSKSIFMMLVQHRRSMRS